MKTVADLALWLETIAPVAYAENWDNVGLLWGDPDACVTRVLTCLTVTNKVADEAIEQKAEVIVSHHPVLFKPVRSIRADGRDRHLWLLAKAGISILSHHTSYDNALGGINDLLARRIGLLETRPLVDPTAAGEETEIGRVRKIVVFVPKSDRDRVLASAFAAGAGQIGNYQECSYSSMGIGAFFGDESTNPAAGERGRLERVRELRVELICPSRSLSRVLEAIRSAHSYEEPAIDVYPLAEAGLADRHPGVGRIGKLSEPEPLGQFAATIARKLSAPGLLFVGAPDRLVQRIAVACGAGDDFLVAAAGQACDVLLTGEARFHRGLDAQALGIGLITAGHHATERPGVEDLANRIQTAFPTLNAWPSRNERDPFQSIS